MVSVASAGSIKLTTDALGISSADYNDGGTVDADVPGKIITSPTSGQGSILTIQKSGLAGSGSIGDPLLVTVTARTHLDNTGGAGTDYKAGIIYLTEENASTPDGKDEGLGVRAFTVDANLNRTFDKGLAKIEGSKEVSGGTDPEPNETDNGAPHVDEDVLFKFNPLTPAVADSIEVLMSKMEATDKIDLQIKLADASVHNFSFIGPGGTGWTQLGVANDKLHKLDFGSLGLPAGIAIDEFTIRALDDNPADPKGTAEHFLITGFTFEEGGGGATPEPASLGILGLGAAALMLRRRK
jgi:hypothetical protein